MLSELSAFFGTSLENSPLEWKRLSIPSAGPDPAVYVVLFRHPRMKTWTPGRARGKGIKLENNEVLASPDGIHEIVNELAASPPPHAPHHGGGACRAAGGAE